MIPIHSLSDARLTPYMNLRERTLRGEQIFIAEGELVVNRLIQSAYPVESVLVVERFLPKLSPQLPKETPVYVVDESMMEPIVGFSFYQGILAAGKRQPLPKVEQSEHLLTQERARLVVLPYVTKPENLGLVFRSSAALGATAVILGEQCCDPFSRRALRVSMGAVLQVPIIACADLVSDLRKVRDRYDFELWGTVLDPDAEELPQIKRRPARLALLFGNEFEGLVSPWLELCDRKVVIPMSPQVDSLNLGVSVGIFMYDTQWK